MMPQEERRHTTRRKAQKRVRIHLDGNPSGIDCVIRNLSADGALIEYSGMLELEKPVVLYFPSENIRVDATAIWQGDGKVGLAFARRLTWLAS